MTTSPEEPSSPKALAWVAVTDDLWVASQAGNFVGTVERVESRFVAIDGRGAPLGVNGDLDLAKARVREHFETHGLEKVRRSRRGSAIDRRVRRFVRRTASAG